MIRQLLREAFNPDVWMGVGFPVLMMAAWMAVL